MTALHKEQKGAVFCVCTWGTHKTQHPTDLFAVKLFYSIPFQK
jgi:hypothetical protein